MIADAVESTRALEAQDHRIRPLASVRADLCRCRRRALDPGLCQFAQQRDQIHAERRARYRYASRTRRIMSTYKSRTRARASPRTTSRTYSRCSTRARVRPRETRPVSGLGLTLVQKLVQMHGGTVRAQSPGPAWAASSRFGCQSSPGRSAGQSSGHAMHAPPSGKNARRRILVVDDNRDAVESLGELLRMDGNEVEVAFDGDAAIRTASKFQPDIVLLDIGMPIVDGYTAAKAIRRDFNGRGFAPGRHDGLGPGGRQAPRYRGRFRCASGQAGVDRCAAESVFLD